MRIKFLKISFLISLLSLLGCIEPEIEKDISKYKPILSEWESTGLVGHFPMTLHSSSKNIKFSSFPGFLQGGGWIQIRMELSPHKVIQLNETAMKRAKQYHDGGNSLTLTNEKEDGLRSTIFRTSESDYLDFPTDYRIFIFEAKPYKVDNDKNDWNHGTSMGMVINLKLNEVIYYAENW